MKMNIKQTERTIKFNERSKEKWIQKYIVRVGSFFSFVFMLCISFRIFEDLQWNFEKIRYFGCSTRILLSNETNQIKAINEVIEELNRFCFGINSDSN